MSIAILPASCARRTSSALVQSAASSGCCSATRRMAAVSASARSHAASPGYSRGSTHTLKNAPLSPPSRIRGMSRWPPSRCSAMSSPASSIRCGVSTWVSMAIGASSVTPASSALDGARPSAAGPSAIGLAEAGPSAGGPATSGCASAGGGGSEAERAGAGWPPPHEARSAASKTMNRAMAVQHSRRPRTLTSARAWDPKSARTHRRATWRRNAARAPLAPSGLRSGCASPRAPGWHRVASARQERPTRTCRRGRPTRRGWARARPARLRRPWRANRSTGAGAS